MNELFNISHIVDVEKKELKYRNVNTAWEIESYFKVV